MRIPFYKMHGGGNDFVLIDHRRVVIPVADQPRFARRVCHRQTGAGADGLILIEGSAKADFSWRFYNADGSVAEMCGNGARCAARFAVLHKLAPENLAFETLAGLIKAEVKGRRVRLNMAGIEDFHLHLDIPLHGASLVGHFLKVGVPHVILPVKDLANTAVVELGRQVRYHPLFQPAGTNADFIRIAGPQALEVRTYERGVEDETLACGTGAVAAALVGDRLGWVSSPVAVHTRGGEILTVDFETRGDNFAAIHLEGDARVVYEGHLWVDELSKEE